MTQAEPREIGADSLIGVTEAPSTTGAARDARVRAALIDLLFRFPLPPIANVVNAVIVGAVLWNVFPRGALAVWIGLMAALNLARLVHWSRYKKAPAPRAQARRWASQYTIGAGLSGLLWGLSASVVFFVDSAPHQVFVAFVAAGMAAGAVATSAAHLPALLFYLLPATIPLAVSFLLQGNPVHVAMGIMVLLFAGMLSLVGRHLNRSLKGTFELQAENAELIESLAKVRDTLEQRVEERTAELRQAIAVRKRAAADLRQSEAQTRLITDNVPVLIGYVDKDRRYTFANKVHEIWFDRPVSDILGRHPKEFLDAFVYGQLRPRIEKALNGEIQSLEVSTRPPDGEPGHFRVNFIPHVSDGGTVQGFFSLIRNITKYKTAEDALKESEARVNQAMSLAQLGHCIWDAVEDRCIYCSDVHARIHGLSPEQYIARASTLDGDFALTHPEDRETYRAAARGLRNGRNFELEYRVVTPDGETRHVREIARAVYDDEGAVVREFVTIQDITDRKEAEEQLRQAQKMEAVGHLTGGMAHDFNNLLGIVLGNLELLEGTLAPDDQRQKYIRAIRHAGKRGADLTQRLLAFSRKQTLQPEAIDLNRLVAEMSGMLSHALGTNIKIRTELAEGLWPAELDPAQMEAALLNLAVNARHAMPDGGELIVETANLHLDQGAAKRPSGIEAGDYVTVAVSDAGAGMAPGVVDKVFEPFFTTKTAGQGSGLGLSMVYGFVKQSGGHARIESAPDEGTTVTLYFPKSEIAAKAVATKLAVLPVEESEGEAILVVDDEPEIKSLAASMLTSLGYRVVVASDGVSALAVLEESPDIDLLFTDVLLPDGMNGFALAKTATARHPSLKVLYTTGYIDDETTREAIARGDAGLLLPKPYTKAHLAREVRQTLDGDPA